jgi:hypothetical protein
VTARSRHVSFSYRRHYRCSLLTSLFPILLTQPEPRSRTMRPMLAAIGPRLPVPSRHTRTRSLSYPPLHATSSTLSTPPPPPIQGRPQPLRPQSSRRTCAMRSARGRGSAAAATATAAEADAEPDPEADAEAYIEADAEAEAEAEAEALRLSAHARL